MATAAPPTRPRAAPNPVLDFVRSHALAIGFAVVALLFPWILNAIPDHDYLLPTTTALICADFVLLALGLNIVVGYAGLLDLGYVAFWAIGAYVMGWLGSTFFIQRNIHFLDVVPPAVRGIHLNFWLIALLGGIACALAGVVIGAPTLRLRGDYLAIVTLGFGEIIPQVFLNSGSIRGFNLTNGAKGITPLDLGGFGNFLHSASGGILPKVILASDFRPRWYIIAFFCFLAVFVSTRIRVGRLGRAWIAIREDELAAAAMGIPLMRTKLAAYAVGAFFGGVGGVFYAWNGSNVFATSFIFNYSALILCMIIVGGMGNVYGVILGGALLSWLNYSGLNVIGNRVNETFGTHFSIPDKNFLIFGIILVAMMLLRPEGFLPAARQKALITEEHTEGDALFAERAG